jgi:MoaD family protein
MSPQRTWSGGSEVTTVLFRTFGHITAITKGSQLEIEFAGTSIEELLMELVRRFGKPMEGILFPQGNEFSEMLYVLVNGKNMAVLNGPKTLLKDGDVISVLPMTAGG